MADYYPIYIYFAIVAIVTLALLASSLLYPSKKYEPLKYLPYESGIRITAHLLQKRFPIRHYLTALVFLISDIEVIFLYPWAVISTKIGAFAFYEIAFFLGALLIGLIYVWRKGGFQWE